MSIIHAARRLSSRTTRPAVIRPVPESFGAGILDNAETPATTTDDSCSTRFDEAQARYRRSRATRLDILHAETNAVLAKIDADLAENRARSEANRVRFERHVAELDAAEAGDKSQGDDDGSFADELVQATQRGAVVETAVEVVTMPSAGGDPFPAFRPSPRGT